MKKTLFQRAKALSAWANAHPVGVQAILMPLGFGVLLSGIQIGIAAQASGYFISLQLLVAVGVGLASLYWVLPEGKRRRDGKRKGAHRRYVEHIVRTAAVAYAAFWIAVASGNYSADTHYQSAQDLWASVQITTDDAAQTNVIAGLQPSKKKARQEATAQRQAKRRNSPQQEQGVGGGVGMILGGVVCILLAVVVAVVMCATACGGLWGWFAVATFGFFGFLGGAIALFILGAKTIARARKQNNIIETPAVPPTPAEPQDVVYLKNGSILKGKLLEIIPEGDIKIQTIDGSIFVFKTEEVDKITKE